MFLWIIFAVMAAVVAGAVLYALRPGDDDSNGKASRPDLAVYKDQLAAIDDELERGLVAESEAETARIEISRRLLAASKRQPDSGVPGGIANRRGLAIFCALAVVGLSLGVYLLSGSPDLPDQPFAARTDAPPEQQDMATLIGRMEAHLEENPQDARGWDILAPIYLRIGRPGDAVRAFAQVIRIDGETPNRLAGLGEALVRVNDGNVTADARAAFVKALNLDPSALRPRFFLIVAEEQDGKVAAALTSWRALLSESPDDAPWRESIEQRIAMLEARLGAVPGSSGQPGPSREDVRDAEELSPAQRREMIEGMVSGLATRLAQDGDDIEGWLRLIRSYAVLGRTGAAAKALSDARAQFAGDDTALERLAVLARKAELEE